MYRIFMMKEKVKTKVGELLCKKSEGVDKIMITIGLCIVALLIVGILNGVLETFVKNLVGEMTTKASGILSSKSF